MIRTGAVLGKEAGLATLRELLHEAEHGSLNCMALRVYRADGGADDLVLGGSAAEQAKALGDLLAMEEPNARASVHQDASRSAHRTRRSRV
jgi:hypothetical protein